MATKSPAKVKHVSPERGRPSVPRQVLRRLTKQKKAFLALAGVGASGFTDISVEHDTYLHEKP